MTIGIPINAMISITVNVLGVDEALYIVKLFCKSILDGTNLGNKLNATSPIIIAIITEEEINANPNFFILEATGINIILKNNIMNKNQNKRLPSILLNKNGAVKKVANVATV